MLVKTKQALFQVAASRDHCVSGDDSMRRQLAQQLGHYGRGDSQGSKGSSSRAQDMASAGQQDNMVGAVRVGQGGGFVWFIEGPASSF